jgi:hypothetical protein
MNGPRIVFTRFGAGDRRRLEPWIQHLRLVAGTAAVHRVDDLVDGVIAWHLAAANYRVLARSAGLFSDIEDARRHADESVAQAGELAPRMVRHEALPMYGWYAASRTAPVITCSRWYATERDRRESFRLAAAALVVAVAGESARSVSLASPGGPR